MPLQGPFWAHVRGGLWGCILPFGMPLTLLVFLKDHVLEATTITGSSMAPTLSPNFSTTKSQDVVLWKQWNPTRNLQRGDVVHFYQPHNPDGTAVKRVIALGGDLVTLDPKRRPEEIANGRVNPAAKGWDRREGRVRVPQGCVWVEGDNVEKTLDSNAYGPISEALIQGKALALVWPLSQFARRPWEGYRSRTKVEQREFERRVGMGRSEDVEEALSDPGR